MPFARERSGEDDGVAVEPLDEDPLHDRAGRATPQVRPGRRCRFCTLAGRPVNGRPALRDAGQRVCGKPRSTLHVAGSGQREVTTLPLV